MHDRPAPGALVWIRHHGKVVVRAYGEADLRTRTRITTDTVFRIGSITKVFTAAATLQLVERRELGLDDEITRYVDFSAGGHRVTVRQLLQQTSGLRNYVAAILNGDGRFDRSKTELMAVVKDASPAFEPGTQYDYSNTNYFLLGLIIEKVSGLPYDAYLAKYVLDRAHLTRTSVCGATARGIATGYVYDGDIPTVEPSTGLDAAFSSGGLCSSAPELARFFDALLAGSIVSASLLTQMQAPAVLPDGRKTPEGFGLAIDTFFGHRRVGHGGSINGFTAQWSWFPDDDLAVIVLSNSDRGAAALMTTRISRTLLGPREVPLTPFEIESIVGTYAKEANPEKVAHRISARDGRVQAVLPNGDIFHMVHLGGLVFSTDEDPDSRIRFAIARDAEPVEHLEVQGQTITFLRTR